MLWTKSCRNICSWIESLEQALKFQDPRILCLHDPFDVCNLAIAIKRHTVATWQRKMVNRDYLLYCSSFSMQTLLDKKFCFFSWGIYMIWGTSGAQKWPLQNFLCPTSILTPAVELPLVWACEAASMWANAHQQWERTSTGLANCSSEMKAITFHHVSVVPGRVS